MKPCLILLRAIELLHAEGFEQIGVFFYIYSLGTWRCELRIGDATTLGTVDAFYHYSSAMEWNYFGDYDKQTTAERLASRLRRRIPDPDAAGTPAPGYRFWYAALLERCGDTALPYYFQEYEDCMANGYVGISSMGDEPVVEGRFPLPPSL